MSQPTGYAPPRPSLLDGETIPGIYRPSGAPYVRPPALAQAEAFLDSVDACIGEVQALGKLGIEQAAYTASKPQAAEHLLEERAASEAFHRFIGKSCVREALESTVRPGADKGPKMTLADSISETKKGSKESEARVDVAVASATAEALFKTKHITRFRKSLTDGGEVEQHGLTNEQTHLDAIVHRSGRPGPLKKYTLAEVRNGFREQQLAAEGTLDDAWLVVASFVPRDVPEEWLDNRGDGYFTRTMTYSLQGTTKAGSGLVLESIFDRGTDAPEEAGYEERQAQRFDLPAYQKVCEWLGLPVPQTELEALENPALIPKAFMPNGMLDFWRWMDIAADEIRGNTVVRAAREYLERDRMSREREASIAGVRQTVKSKLLAADSFVTKIDANVMLWELIKEHGYRAAAHNEHIQPIAFGVKGARKLKVAKNLISLGQTDDAGRWIEWGLDDATTTGCGGGACGLREAVTIAELAFAKSKLGFQDGDSIAADERLACPDCKEIGGILYVYNASKVNKGCKLCGAVEIGENRLGSPLSA